MDKKTERTVKEMANILIALEKQKPIELSTNSGLYLCLCGRPVSEWDNYCRECGQAIKCV